MPAETMSISQISQFDSFSFSASVFLYSQQSADLFWVRSSACFFSESGATLVTQCKNSLKMHVNFITATCLGQNIVLNSVKFSL